MVSEGFFGMEADVNGKPKKSGWSRGRVRLTAVLACLFLISTPFVVSSIRAQRHKAFIASLEARGVEITWTDGTYPDAIETLLIYLDTYPPRPQKIATLSAAKCDLTDEDLRALGTLDQTCEINLSGTAITDEGLRLLSNSKSLLKLELFDTNITGKSLKYLENQTTLTGLGLANTLISDDDLVHLKKMTALKVLMLHGTKATMKGVHYLSDMKQLSFLSLSQKDPLTDDDLEPLSALDSLEALYPGNVPINDETYRKLSRIPQLKVLAISDENLQLSDKMMQEAFRSGSNLIIKTLSEDRLNP